MSREIISPISGFSFKEYYESIRFFFVVAIRPNRQTEGFVWRAINIEDAIQDFVEKYPDYQIIYIADIHDALNSFAFIHETEHNLLHK